MGDREVTTEELLDRLVERRRRRLAEDGQEDRPLTWEGDQA